MYSVLLAVIYWKYYVLGTVVGGGLYMIFDIIGFWKRARDEQIIYGKDK